MGLPSVLPHPDQSPNLNKYVVKYDVKVNWEDWRETVEPSLEGREVLRGHERSRGRGSDDE